MKISLTAWFDETEYRNNYPNLDADDLESVMIEDFCEMIRKQYIGNEPMQTLEFVMERKVNES